mmetsp:Transcript_18714/g.25935  ORF Transcript_18714/g.25935 Transcript_18714/m.25935 type:complete len:90 (-) Transcript_18714:866-1135(-)
MVFCLVHLIYRHSIGREFDCMLNKDYCIFGISGGRTRKVSTSRDTAFLGTQRPFSSLDGTNHIWEISRLSTWQKKPDCDPNFHPDFFQT